MEDILTLSKVSFLLDLGSEYLRKLILNGKLNAYTKEGSEDFFVRELDARAFPPYEKPLVPIKNSEGYYSALQISKIFKKRHETICNYIITKKLKSGDKLKNGALFLHVKDWNVLKKWFEDFTKAENNKEDLNSKGSYFPYCPFVSEESQPLTL
jgi:hypothetical protein